MNEVFANHSEEDKKYPLATEEIAEAHQAYASVVPMEITFMDNGGNIFILCEFINYVNSHII
jgi:hypothetical protein